MSGPPSHPRDETASLLASAAVLEPRARARRRAAIGALLAGESAWCDERLASRFSAAMEGLVADVERAILDHAGDQLERVGEGALGERLRAHAGRSIDLVARAALSDEAVFLDTVFATVRLDLLGDDIPAAPAREDEGQSLLARLSQSDDTMVAEAATRMMHADAATQRETAIDLPQRSRVELAWHVAAALRELAAGSELAMGPADLALCAAARRYAETYPTAATRGALAMQLAASLDLAGEALGAVMVEALGDRRLLLFAALLATRIDLDLVVAADMILDRDGDALWAALRAAELSRPVIARIAFLLSEADPQRDIERFAERLDAIAAIEAEAAHAAIARLTLDAGYRAALHAVARARNVQ